LNGRDPHHRQRKEYKSPLDMPPDVRRYDRPQNGPAPATPRAAPRPGWTPPRAATARSVTS
jgi:hypothetical protein